MRSILHIVLTFALLVLGISRSLADEKAAGRNDWEALLDKACEGADEIEIKAGPWSKKSDFPDFKISGADKVKTFLKLVQIDESRSGNEMMTDGEVILTLKKGEKSICELEYLFSICLRWTKGKWTGDACLKQEAMAALPKWFADEGYPALKKSYDARVEEADRVRKQHERFESFFPKRAHGIIFGRQSGDFDTMEEEEKNAGDKLRTAVNDDKELLLAICRALGSADSSWSQTGGKERVVIASAHAADAAAFVAVAKDIARTDTEALLGAARLYFWEDLAEKADVGTQAALAAKLGAAALNKGCDQNKPLTLRCLGKIKSAETQQLLKSVMDGSFGVEMSTEKQYGQEPGIRASAALALANQGEDISTQVNEMLKGKVNKSDKAALEISLALLGNHEMIKKEHFVLESYTVGYAGLEAIKRFKGAWGMEVLIDGAFEHPWANVSEEAGDLFQELVGKRWNNSENMRNSNYFDKMRVWWKENGAEFVKKAREAWEAEHKTDK